MLTPKSATRKDLVGATVSSRVMQHRHFAIIAGVIARIPDRDQREEMAEHFAVELGGTNPKFARKRFLRACGVADA